MSNILVRALNISMIRFCAVFRVPQRVNPLAPRDQHCQCDEAPLGIRTDPRVPGFKVKLTRWPNHVVTTSGDAQRPVSTFGSVLTPNEMTFLAVSISNIWSDNILGSLEEQ